MTDMSDDPLYPARVLRTLEDVIAWKREELVADRVRYASEPENSEPASCSCKAEYTSKFGPIEGVFMCHHTDGV